MLRDSENDLKLVMQALKEEKQCMEDKFATMNENVQKAQENFDNVQMEKRDLVALNNELTAQVHQINASSGGNYYNYLTFYLNSFKEQPPLTRYNNTVRL